MPRLTSDQWAAVRLEWEGEPVATYSSLAAKYNIEVSNISRRCAKEGWVKRGQLASINEAAQRKADARCDANGNANASETQRACGAADLATRDESIDLRAEVLERHRREWSELEAFRKVALKAMKDAHEAGDREAWSVAKTAADTAKSNISALEIKQQGERRAWGLEAKAEEEYVITNPRPRE